MRKHVWVIVWLAILCFVGLAPVLGNAAEPDQQDLSDLLNTLDQKIKDADQRRVAHPKFLEELRALVKQYRAKIRVVFLGEDFADGEYSRNPKWVVDSGTFRVTKDRRLLSEATAETQSSTSSEKEKTTGLSGVLKDILKTPDEEEKTSGAAPAAKTALIHTLASIGPAFEVDLTLVSRSTRGFMELVLLGGDQNVPYYRMTYRASAARARPIEIIRERDGKSFTIDAAPQFVSLDDNVPHRIQWIRDSMGRMRILIDEKEVLSTYEFYYQGNFTGLAFVNRGGIYEVGPVMVYQTQEAKTQ